MEYGIYHGVSANSTRLWRNDRARDELGYQPLDDSAEYADQVPDDLPDGSSNDPDLRQRILHLT